MATSLIQEHEALVDADAKLSHFGFRSRDKSDWEYAESQFLSLGYRYVTQDRGRDFIFVKLNTPIVVGRHVLEYIEFPEPKTPAVVEPSTVLFFTHSQNEKASQTVGDCIIRQGLLGATDHIKRAGYPMDEAV